MQKDRQHCTRIGCRRFTYDIQPIVIRTGKVEHLCPFCRAIVLEQLERITRKGPEEVNILQFVRDKVILGIDRAIGFVDKGRVTLYRPWANIEEQHAAEQEDL